MQLIITVLCWVWCFLGVVVHGVFCCACFFCVPMAFVLMHPQCTLRYQATTQHPPTHHIHPHPHTYSLLMLVQVGGTLPLPAHTPSVYIHVRVFVCRYCYVHIMATCACLPQPPPPMQCNNHTTTIQQPHMSIHVAMLLCLYQHALVVQHVQQRACIAAAWQQMSRPL